MPIIAQIGEAILSRQGVAAAGGDSAVEAMNSGRGGSQQVVNNIIKTDVLFPDAAADTIDRLQSGLLRRGVGSVNAALRRGKVAGFKAKA